MWTFVITDETATRFIGNSRLYYATLGLLLEDLNEDFDAVDYVDVYNNLMGYTYKLTKEGVPGSVFVYAFELEEY